MDRLKELEELIINNVEALDDEKVIQLSNEALNGGMNPLYLLELVNIGMDKVGKLYEKKDYYIADLILAGLIFREVLTLDKMKKYFKHWDKRIGKVLIGTVQGDIHDIGKDIFKTMLQASGFEVVDLGVDVPRDLFLKEAVENNADILGLSGPLTNTVEEMKAVVELFVKSGARDQVKIIIGATHVTKDICKYIGADSFANDASAGLRQCLDWMKYKK